MAKIQQLDAHLTNMIAAGEVVERPMGVIKELVENALDAKATRIEVNINQGGTELMEVIDNGVGMDREDACLCFERHATSKIRKSSDLNSIATLGFRGEALASIAAVAKVTCTTRTHDQVAGIRAVNEGGQMCAIEDAACPEGTTFVVRDLFYNTPVRLKFLKKPAAEAALVADYMQRLILSRPDVAFRFASQGKTIYHSMGDGKLESALYCLYGREAFAMMRKVSGHMNGIVLSGYVGTGELSRGNRQQQVRKQDAAPGAA